MLCCSHFTGKPASKERTTDMKLKIMTALTALTLMSGAAMASSIYCNAPKSKWMSVAAIKAKVTRMGYKVRKIEVDDGCYEAYAIDANGRRMEIYLNPATAAVVKMERDD